MNPSISIACDASFGAGSENFGTVTGNVTFQDGSANSGTVNGNAVFEGTAENKASATITGNATFAATAVNNGTVTGTVTVEISQEAAYAAWLAANTGVNQYTVAGYKNGQWAYNSTEQVGQNSAIAAQSNALYPGWLSANTGVNQYQGLYGDKYGQWAWNQTEYPGEAQANEAQTLHFAGFVSETTDIRQYLVAGANYGKWAYNSTEMTLNPANISSAPQYWNDTTYSFGDVVVNASRQIWVCVSASPVDSNFSTPGTSSDWVQIA